LRLPGRSAGAQATAPLLLLGLLVSVAAPLDFVVIGDRTGSARPEVFRQVVAEAAALKPGLVVGVGDLIEGYSDDAAALNAEWDTVLGVLAQLECRFAQAPGNHDVTGAAAESVYRQRLGATGTAFVQDGCRFVLFDNSRWERPESLPPGQLTWLAEALKPARHVRRTFVLMHRPYWRYALEQGRPDSLHVLFRAAGVEAVFTGHDHFYCAHVRDGVRYFQVGPSGSRTKVHHDPDLGGFQNYLFCRATADTVLVEVREPGSGVALSEDTITLESVRALLAVKSRALALEPVAVPAHGGAPGPGVVRLRNATDDTQVLRLRFACAGTGWRVRPESIRALVAAGDSVRHALAVELAAAESVYPLPGYSLPYRYLRGRTATLEGRLPVRRAGRLGEPGGQGPATARWFGSSDGSAGDGGRTEVWLGIDSVAAVLHIAARCAVSDRARVKSRPRRRDDKVYEDEHLNLVLCPDPAAGTYYQLFVNPDGAIADRACRAPGKRDWSWDGNWQVATRREPGAWTVELACPPADFGSASPEWSGNFVRYESERDSVWVWQVPFEHDPETFGRLVR